MLIRLRGTNASNQRVPLKLRGSQAHAQPCHRLRHSDLRRLEDFAQDQVQTDVNQVQVQVPCNWPWMLTHVARYKPGDTVTP